MTKVTNLMTKVTDQFVLFAGPAGEHVQCLRSLPAHDVPVAPTQLRVRLLHDRHPQPATARASERQLPQVPTPLWIGTEKCESRIKSNNH